MQKPLSQPESTQVLVIGAGMAGLSTARRLVDEGRSVLVLDKGRGPGGRMATRRIEDGVFDHGAQFFTAREAEFRSQVEQWETDGTVREWCRAIPGDEPVREGRRRRAHPRFVGTSGMAAVCKRLAEGVPVMTNRRVVNVVAHGVGWEAWCEDGTIHAAESMVLTSPVPQTLALLSAGGVSLSRARREELESIAYDPCLCLMVLLDGPTLLPEPGARRFTPGPEGRKRTPRGRGEKDGGPADLGTDSEGATGEGKNGAGAPDPGTDGRSATGAGNPIAWMADNHLKGVSPRPGSLTIHATPEFSARHWPEDDEAVARGLLGAASAHFRSRILRVEVKRWRYSLPRTVVQDRCVDAMTDPPLVLAGDAFGGPRVEGAALSGRAAAAALLPPR